MSINKSIIVGHLGADPEIKTFENGGKIANFRVATSMNYTNKQGEKVTHTEWHNIVIKNKLADVAEKYFKKGMQLYIEGFLHTRSWDDKDGVKHYTTEIICQTVQMLGSKQSENNSQSDNNNANNVANQQENIEDDLPF